MSPTEISQPAEVEADETRNLIAADKVEGTAVYNRSGQNIGAIKTVMLNKYNGRVAYAVLASGGFLGIGEQYYPVPWEALRYDTELGGYVVPVDSDDFDNAPRYPADAEPNWADKLFNEDLRRYYGLGAPAG
jgi:sporulation protein YlmC with PRC-barrel domain